MSSTLEITIQRRVDGSWPVVVVDHRVGTLLPVRSEGRLQLASEPMDAARRSYGTTLGQALFRDAVRDAFVRARNEGPDGVRVLVFVEAEELKSWRWEWLCAPVDGDVWDFLSLDQRALFSLYLPSLTDRAYPPIGRHDLRALVVVANPTDPKYSRLASFDGKENVGRLQSVFGDQLPATILARVPAAAGVPTLDEVVRQLTAGSGEGPYTILHVVCHGWVNPEKETILYLEQPSADPASGRGLAQPVKGSDLIERLRRIGRLPYLIFLSTCESSAPEAEQRMGGLAQRLVRELGIPAVIGMTERVTIATAHALADEFYRRLLAQARVGEVDRALVQAYAGLAARPDVNVPALYSRLGAQPLFSLALDRPLTPAESRSGLQQLDELLVDRAPVLRTRLAEKAQKLEPLLGTDPDALAAPARQEGEKALTEINELCQEAVEINFNALAQGEQPPAYDSRQPFRGLSPFRAEDREFFFGREALVQKLEQKLNRDNFLPVLGPSGSGKSSLVLAGLVPKLKEQVAGLQVMDDLTPGSAPMDQLKIRQAKLSSGPVLYVVDQFEELFTLCKDEKQRQDFIDELLRLADSNRVVLTMRADFWGECATYPALKERMQARQELIAPMTTSELRGAMEQQAAKVGLRFEADLSNTMLDEVAGEPGAMPLLQHALLELWKRRHGRWMRAEEYRTIGGVKKAIAETADQVYNQLGEEDRQLLKPAPPADRPTPTQDRMRDVFVRLTQIDENVVRGEERRDTRRRLSVSDLVPAGSKAEETKALLKKLADAALVVTSRNEVTGQDEGEVAHEALIRHWGKLRTWLDEDLTTLKLRDSITEAAKEWQAKPSDENLLVHRGSRLDSAMILLIGSRIPLTAAESEYLNACRSRYTNELGEARRIAKRLKFRAALLGALAVALLLAAVLLFFSRRAVVQDTLEARSRYWATEASTLFSAHPERALDLAVLAIRTAPQGTATYGFAREVIWNLLSRTGGEAFDHGLGLITAAISDDGSYLATGGSDGVLIRNLTDRSSKRFRVNTEATNSSQSRSISWMQFVPHSHRLIVADVRDRGAGPLCSIDLGPGASTFGALTCDPRGNVSAVVIDPKLRWLVVGRESGVVELYNLASFDLSTPPQFSLKAHALKVASAAVSANGDWLATGGDEGLLQLWNLQSDPALTQPLGFRFSEGRVSAVAFNSERKLLLAASGFQMNSDGSGAGRNPSILRLWSLGSQTIEHPRAAVKTSLLEVTSILSASSYAAVLGYQGINPNFGPWKQKKSLQLFTVQPPKTFDPLKDSESGPQLTAIPSNEGQVYDAAILPGTLSKWLITSFVDGHLELRPLNGSDKDSPTALWAHEGGVWTVQAGLHGFVTAGSDGRARLWRWGGTSGGVATALPEPLSSWTADDFYFAQDNSSLFISHSYHSISVWLLGPYSLSAISSVPRGRRIIDGRPGPPYICDDQFSDSSCTQLANPISQPHTKPIPGFIMDTNPGHNLVLVRSESSLRVCVSGQLALNCGRPTQLKTQRAHFTADGKNVVATIRGVRCQGHSCDFGDKDTAPFTTITWLRVQSDGLVIEATQESPYDFAYQDGDWLLLTSQDARSPKGGVLYRLRDGPTKLQPILTLPASIGSMTDATIIDHRWLLVGNWRISSILRVSPGNTVCVVDVSAGQPLGTLRLISVAGGTIRSMGVSSNSVFLGQENGAISILDLRTRSLRNNGFGHDAAVTAIAVSVDSGMIASGDESGEIKVWTQDDRHTTLSDVRPFVRRVDSLAFSPNGNWLAASAVDEAPRVFSLDREVLASTAERIAGRPLSPVEKRQFGIFPQ